MTPADALAAPSVPPSPAGPRQGQAWRRRARAYAGILAVLLVSWFLFDIPGLAESRMVYFPLREPFATPPGREDVTFKTSDGLTLHGWLTMPTGWKPGDPPVSAILHIHGNAGNISYHDAFSDYLPAAGYAVLLFDYRGYGRSDPARGRLHRRLLLEDARAALDFLLQRPEIDPARIGIYGVSLGGVIGTALAAERPEVRAIISLAAFSSWTAIARDHLGPVGWLLARGGLDADESVRRLGDRPLLIIHGEADDIVSARHARRLHEAAVGAGIPAELLIVPGIGHNDLAIDDPATQGRVIEFLGRCLAPG
jgi:dipeptidyl aminopeptidase/acylaminoacyl peptidase